MPDPEDKWPLPDYNPGRHYHLHALGVIAVVLASFEQCIDALYKWHPRTQKLPIDLINLYYYALNEEKRIEAVRTVFDAYEQENELKKSVNNLLDYFQRCRANRNQLLHAEQYPYSFGGDPDILHLRKRIGKQAPKSGYIALSLPALRAVAEKTRAGTIQAARLLIYLRLRGVPLERISLSLKPFFGAPLPKRLPLPRLLKLSDSPQGGLSPKLQPSSSPETHEF